MIKAFVVVSRYKESVEWVKSLTDNYIIYNKGESLPNFKQMLCENIGANQYDIVRFIYDNYDNLPDLIAFLQGDPFDHCLVDRFYDLIRRDSFTPIFGDRNYPSGEYFEPNTSWYLHEPWQSHKPPCKFASFDDYCRYLFSDYAGSANLVFPPGSQFLVEKQRCLFYSRSFWKKIMDIIPTQPGINGGREAHIIERSLQLIFENKYSEVK